MKKLLIAALASLSLPVIADVPNTFVAGTPAKAAEVNENFAALDTKVTAIDSISCENQYNMKPVTSQSYSYEYINATVGDVVTISDTDYLMMSMPFRELGSGDIYTIKLPVNQNDYFSLKYVKAGRDCNRQLVISGYQSSVLHSEEFSYSLSSGKLNVYQHAGTEASIVIQVGSTWLSVRGGPYMYSNIYSDVTPTGSDLGLDIDMSLLQSDSTYFQAVDDYIDYISITKVVAP